ncbi:hypothetical protein DIPPA_13174, partial [Diplonema papillatum]
GCAHVQHGQPAGPHRSGEAEHRVQVQGCNCQRDPDLHRGSGQAGGVRHVEQRIQAIELVLPGFAQLRAGGSCFVRGYHLRVGLLLHARCHQRYKPVRARVC